MKLILKTIVIFLLDRKGQDSISSMKIVFNFTQEFTMSLCELRHGQCATIDNISDEISPRTVIAFRYYLRQQGTLPLQTPPWPRCLEIRRPGDRPGTRHSTPGCHPSLSLINTRLI